MKRMIVLARLEAGLWLRSTGFWLAVLAMHFSGLDPFSFGRLHTARALWGDILGDGLLLASIFILFTSAAAMLRDRSERTEELLDSLPATNARLFLSRWLGGAAAWLLIGLELLALIGLTLTLQEGAVLEIWPLISFFLSHYLPIVLFIHTLGMALGVFIRQPFILYPTLMMLWAGATFVVMDASRTTGRGFLSLFHMIGIGVGVRNVSVVVGLFPFEDRLFWQRIFFGGVTLLLITVAIAAFRSQRETGDARRPRRLRQSFTGAAVAAVVIAFGSYGYIHQYLSASTPSASSLSSPPFVVDGYNLHVQMDQPDWYDVTAEFAVRNTSRDTLSEIDLLLSPDCQLFGNSTDGTGARPTQHENVVTLAPVSPLAADSTTTFQLAYRCHVYPHAQRIPTFSGRNPFVASIIYPTPASTGELDQPLPHFTLTVEAPSDFKMATNIPKVAQEYLSHERVQTRYVGETERLEVLGGPFAYEDIEGFEIYYYPIHKAAVQDFITELSKRTNYYTSWLGNPERAPGITPLPVLVEDFRLSSPVLTERPRGRRGFFTIAERFIPQFYRSGKLELYQQIALDNLALSLWWGDIDLLTLPHLGMFAQISAIEGAAIQYLTVLFGAHQNGDTWFDEVITMVTTAQPQTQTQRIIMTWPIRDPFATLRPGSITQAAAFLTFHEVRTSLGDDALKTVLQALQQRHLELARTGLEPSATRWNQDVPIQMDENLARLRIATFVIPGRSEDESLRFLFDTIRSLPGGAAVAERSLQYLPGPTANQLRQEWRRDS